jgi:hypothetical protein
LKKIDDKTDESKTVLSQMKETLDKHTLILQDFMNLLQHKNLSTEDLSSIEKTWKPVADKLDSVLQEIMKGMHDVAGQLHEVVVRIQGLTDATENQNEKLILQDILRRLEISGKFSVNTSVVTSLPAAVELEITDTIVGTGGSGEVRLGKYHGAMVACKMIKMLTIPFYQESS